MFDILLKWYIRHLDIPDGRELLLRRWSLESLPLAGHPLPEDYGYYFCPEYHPLSWESLRLQDLHAVETVAVKGKGRKQTEAQVRIEHSLMMDATKERRHDLQDTTCDHSTKHDKSREVKGMFDRRGIHFLFLVQKKQVASILSLRTFIL